MATKPCIACAEEIQEAAKLCKHCGTMQTDRRFQERPQVVIKSVPTGERAKFVSRLNQPERICNRCKTYVVQDSGYDSCEVCRGITKTGTLPGAAPQEPEEVFQSATISQSRSYSNVPLAPTPGIAVAAIIVAFFIPVLGLILGYSARTEVRNPNNPKEGDGLATGAIAIGWLWIVVGIIWIVAVAVAAGNAAASIYN